MAGASSRRGKADRKNKQPASNNPPPGQGRAPADPTPAAPAQRGQPGPATGPPSAGQPSGRGREPEVAAPVAEQSVRSGSREPSASREDTAAEAAASDAVRQRQSVFNRNVDFAGNAYNLVAEVSQKFVFSPCLPWRFRELQLVPNHSASTMPFTTTEQWLNVEVSNLLLIAYIPLLLESRNFPIVIIVLVAD